MNSSDENLNQQFNNLGVVMDGSIAGSTGATNYNRTSGGCDPSNRDDQPSTSSHGYERRRVSPPRVPTPEERANQLVKEAEAAKARIRPTTGKHKLNTAQIDENYIVVGNHLDTLTTEKIERGEYVDFGKLVPKDRVMVQEDQRLEMVIRGGKTFYVPVSDSTEITSFSRWEQAFTVYSNIYTKANPQRSPELIEYNHVIHTISLTYIWDNVYLYDKDFQIHLSHNPQRSWSIILQQAWSLRLKDCIHSGQVSSSHGMAHSPQDGKAKIHEPCKRYNWAKCTFGATCRYEHRCSYCLKFGHALINCRKMLADKEIALNKHRESSGNNPNHSRDNISARSGDRK